MRTFEQAYPLLNRFLHSTARPAMTLSLSLARSAGAERRGAARVAFGVSRRHAVGSSNSRDRRVDVHTRARRSLAGRN